MDPFIERLNRQKQPLSETLTIAVISIGLILCAGLFSAAIYFSTRGV